MKAWKYRLGEWTEIEDPLVWNKDDEWKTALSRGGYSNYPSTTYGEPEYDAGAELYTKEDGEPPYLISFSLAGFIESVYIDDVPSLMQWLRDYTPLFSLHQIAETQDELQTLFERAFRAWHGHSYMDVCPRCDPMEFKRREEAHQRRTERQKTK